MEVILLEKIANLGNLGDKVNVKAGYGRNYLPLLQLLPTWLHLKHAVLSWNRLLPTRKLRPKSALRIWLSWKSPSPLPRAMKASCSVPSVLTTSLTH